MPKGSHSNVPCGESSTRSYTRFYRDVCLFPFSHYPTIDTPLDPWPSYLGREWDIYRRYMTRHGSVDVHTLSMHTLIFLHRSVVIAFVVIAIPIRRALVLLSLWWMTRLSGI